MLPQLRPHFGVDVAGDALDAAAARETADIAFGHALDRVAQDLAITESQQVRQTTTSCLTDSTYRCLFATLLFPFPNPTPSPLEPLPLIVVPLLDAISDCSCG